MSGLVSVLRQPPALAAVTGLPVQVTAGDPADASDAVSSAATSADVGPGKGATKAPETTDPGQPASPEAKPFTTPPKLGDESSFDEATSERLPEKSSATYDEFRNEDGSITRHIYDSPVNYKASDGTYQPIDATLTPQGDRLEAGANSIDVSLSAVGADAAAPATTEPSPVTTEPSPATTESPLASTGPSPASTDASPETASLPAAERVESADEALVSVTASGRTIAYDLAGAAAVPAIVDGETATYRDILPHTDLELRSLNNGLKETLILKSPAAGNEWVFPLKLEGLTAKKQADGSLHLLAADGSVAMLVPRGWMEDSKVDPRSGAPAESSQVRYDLITVDGGPALKVTADAAWLNDPVRQYPVRVDPTLQTADTGDVFVDDTSTTGNHNGDDLPVGTWDGGSTRSRSFIHFDRFDNDKLVGTQIMSAKLSLWHSWSYNCTNTEPVYVHRVTQSWTVADIVAAGGTLASGPSYSTPISAETINSDTAACRNTGSNPGNGTRVAMDLPIHIFNGWSLGTLSNFGLALTASETQSAGFKRFTSANYGTSTNPYLELTYDYNAEPQVNEQYPGYGAATTTLTPELIADALDPDNWPKSLQYKFIVYAKDNKTTIAETDWTTKRSWVVPAGKLQWNESYYWTVLVRDGLADNSRYATKHLLVTPVPQPSVTSSLSQNSGQGFDPVIGNYTTSARDAMVNTVGPPLEIVRSYNSIDPRTDQAFGAGWSSVADAKVVEKSQTTSGSTVLNTVVVTYPTGRELAFGRNSDGSYSSPAGKSLTLAAIPAAQEDGYLLREKDGTTYRFSRKPVAGKLVLLSITDNGGRQQKFHYTGNRLTSIESASGRKLHLAWTTTTPPRVSTVSTDPAFPENPSSVSTWTYRYTGDNLTAVCPPVNPDKCHTYQYGTASSLYPTAVTNTRPSSYWRLNETSGTRAESTTLENGGADVGTYNNSVALGQAGPMAGTTSTVAGFDGTSSQVRLPAGIANDASNQAVAMWFKATAGTGVLLSQSGEDANSTATTTHRAYNPTLYVGWDGRLMGSFPKALSRDQKTPLTVAATGKCLAVKGNSAANDTMVELTGCNGANNQLFTWTTVGQLKVDTGGETKCLEPEDQNTTNGTLIVTRPCSPNSEYQRWDVRANGQIVHLYSYACMDSSVSVKLENIVGAAMRIMACGKDRPLDQTILPRTHDPLASSVNIVDGKWHFVVLSTSGNKQEMYLDGNPTPVDYQTGITIQDIGPRSAFLGKGFLGGGWPNGGIQSNHDNKGTRNHFKGSIGEVAVFDNAVDSKVVTELWAAQTFTKPATKLLTRVARPSEAASASITYNTVTGRVSEVTDGNGEKWTPEPPTVTGTTQVYESAVLGGAPTNYWRMAETGTQIAKNEINGSDANYNNVLLGREAGPFDAPDPIFPGRRKNPAPTFRAEDSSYLALPAGVTPPNSSSVSMWFKTSSTARTVLLGMQYSSTQSATRYDRPTMWISPDGKLRALSPSNTPTGPINAVQVAGKCLDLNGGASADGTAVQSWACNGSIAQNWQLVPVGTDFSKYTIRAFNKCLTPAGGATANGTKLTLWTCNGDTSQQWQASAGRLYNLKSQRCLDIPNGSGNNGIDLTLWDCNTTVAQGWLPSLTSNTKVNDDKWHHAVLTTNGKNQTLYVDGAKAQSSTGSTDMNPNTTARYTLGAGYVEGAPANFYYVDSAATSYFSGSIAEVAFYSSEIDATQASYQFKARDAAKKGPFGQVDYTITGPDGIKTTTVNDLVYGRKVADVNGRGNETRYGYSGKGHLRTVTDANGNMTINEHDDRGNVVSVTTCQDRSADNCSTSYSKYFLDTSDPTHIRNDRLIEQRGPGSESATQSNYLTTYTYDPVTGNRLTETDPIGRRTTITYTTANSANGAFDGVQTVAGLPWRIVKPDGGMQTIRYHRNGDVAEVIDPAGAVTRYRYDGLGRTVEEVQLADPGVPGSTDATTTYAHDALDRVVEVRAPEVANAVNGERHRPVTTVVYNVDGLMESETVSDARGGDASRTVSYGYDGKGRRISETDENNDTTRLKYDAYGRVVEQIHADDSVVKTEFDAAGNETATIVVNGTRDELGNKKDLTVRKLAYDPAGRLASETDTMGVTSYTYTDNNLLVTTTRTSVCTDKSPQSCTPQSYVLEHNSYDKTGKVEVQLTNNNRTKTTRAYDNAGRNISSILEVTEPGKPTTYRTTTFTYSPDDEVLSTQAWNDKTLLSRSDTAYDRLGRRQQQTTYLSAGQTPVARWKLNETAGATATDSAGNNHGTVTGGVTWSEAHAGTAADAQNSRAARFDGTAPGGIIGQPAVDIQRPYTLTAWANLESTTGQSDRYVASMNGDTGSSALKLLYHKDSASWQLAMSYRKADGTIDWLTSQEKVPATTGAWTHLAVAVNPATQAGATSTADLYVAGVRKAGISTTEPLNNRATDLRIGAAADSTGTFLGTIDDVRLYQSALTAAEIGQVRAGTLEASGQVSRTTFDLSTDGSVTSVTDPHGRITRIENDAIGRAVKTFQPEVHVEGHGSVLPTTKIGYNTFGEVTDQEDPNGNKSVNRYDGVGRLVESQAPSYTRPDKVTVTAKRTVVYNEVGQVTSSTDPRGYTTEYRYDELGRTTEITAPDTGKTRYEYADSGDLLKLTDPNGAVTASTYDYLGRTVSSTTAVREDNAGYTTNYAYGDGSDWRMSVTSPKLVVSTVKFNSAGEPIEAIDGATNSTKTTYDLLGRPVTTLAADGTYSTVTYDFAGRAVRQSDHAAPATAGDVGAELRRKEQTYDIAGSPVRITNAYKPGLNDPASPDAKHETTFEYDVLGRLTEQYEPVSASETIHTSFRYDAAGNRTKFTDGRRHDFLTEYNSWGLPEKQIEPATAATPNPTDRTFTMSYNEAGLLARLDSPGGVSIESRYDNMGRLERSIGSGAQVATTDRTYKFDKAGRMTEFSGSAGTNTIEYNDRGLPEKITGVSGNSAYTYNEDGALASRTDGAGTTSYLYEFGRLKSTTNTAASVDMTYEYNNLNQVKSIRYGATGGNVRQFGYDGLHRLVSDELKTNGGTGATVGKIAYGWNTSGTLNSKVTTGFNGASSNSYKYDWAGRLTEWNNGTNPVLYVYDQSGNRLQAGTKTFTYDERNQLVDDSAGTVYQYTPRGTLASTTLAGQTTETRTDAFNQVIHQGTKTGGTSTYSYDGLGRMIQPGLTFTGLGNDLAADGTTAYVRDPAGDLVGVASGSNKRYAWTDIHTDVVGEFGATGAALTGSVSYDPWGKILAGGGMVGKLGYQQEWTDQGTGKVNMWSRWYDPETGAFDTRDTANNNPTPTSGASNRFAYAEGNPVTNTDTTGNAVDGKCGEYDYACELKKYQAAMKLYTAAMEQRDRDMKAVGLEIAAQEAEYLRAERESNTPLLDILLQVGIGMLLDMIGYNSLMGCIGGALMDCVDLALNGLGPFKAAKMLGSLIKAVDRALSGYRTWKRIVEGAQAAMRQAQGVLNAARKHLNDIVAKVPFKPKMPKKKVKPPEKKQKKQKQEQKRQESKQKQEEKPQASKQAREKAPRTDPKEQSRPKGATKPESPESKNSGQQRKDLERPERNVVEPDNNQPVEAGCPKHSFDPDTRVLMADRSTRAISEITIGDEVLATDPETGEEGARQVTLLHANLDRELTDVTVTSAPADTEAKQVNEGKGDRSTRGPTESSVLKTTAHHPFWDVTTSTWVNAAKLTPGESTLIGPAGEIQYVTKVRNHTGAEVMRDLTVDDIHTYYVIASNAPVLVHNYNNCKLDFYDFGDSTSGPGGQVRYGKLDHLGRPTGMWATVTQDMLDQGQPARGLTIKGLPKGQGTIQNLARGHLLADRLGGKRNKSNLAAITQDPLNSPIMRDGIEQTVYDAVKSGQKVQYIVEPLYDGDSLVPRALRISAYGTGPNALKIDPFELKNPAGMFGVGDEDW
ncbi:LamG-like jellyroll fold domain-containing protein [Actinoplanes italicus]|uniref:LamG-like jellyroll fold domain-containing protein n=1 Tax=Actinoplanes italicus TaxID=113567 RepID=UPI001474E492|nr:LamG-like jellyroll fold domain-containing protein [Actinoplanes italicus]